MDRNSDDIGSVGRGIPLPECPNPIVWYEIATGELAPDLIPKYVQHATDCDTCGRRLREAVSDTSDETSASETKQITDLESARPRWQRNLAQRIAITPPPEPTPLFGWLRRPVMPRLALAGAGLLALAIVGYRYQVQRTEQEQVGRFLAQAAGERRVTELRMAGAPHAVLAEGLQRDNNSTFLDAPGALLKAEALIHDQLASHPSDPVWLHAKAKADLLDGNYDPAAATLTRALELNPKSPEILTDLATAYFEQKNFAAAYEKLSQVLVLRPNDPVALFNRAIVAENQFLYRQALMDWENYLKVDPNSEWATEARAKADAVRKKLENHDQSRAAPLLLPSQMVELQNDPESRLKVDEHIEEYLDAAVSDWLPKAYPGSPKGSDTTAQQALFFFWRT